MLALDGNSICTVPVYDSRALQIQEDNAPPSPYLCRQYPAVIVT